MFGLNIFGDIKNIIFAGTVLVLITSVIVGFYSYNKSLKEVATLKIEKTLLEHNLNEMSRMNVYLDNERRVQESKVIENRKIIDQQNENLVELYSKLDNRSDSSDLAPQYYIELFRGLMK